MARNSPLLWLACHFMQCAPQIAQSWNHLLIKLTLGRYPSFMSALRDLDDPLTLVHLFATLPAEKAVGIPAEAVATARRLSLEWQAWIVRAHALRKAFISVKGFYFQADVLGQSVTWLVPHALAQVPSAFPHYCCT